MHFKAQQKLLINGCDTCFRWQSRQNKGDTETSEDHDLQTSYGESLLCNQAHQEKGPFKRLEIYKYAWLRSTMTHSGADMCRFGAELFTFC